MNCYAKWINLVTDPNSLTIHMLVNKRKEKANATSVLTFGTMHISKAT